VDKRSSKLLAATQQLLKKLVDLSSCPSSSASPVLGDDANTEQDITVILDLQKTPFSPAVHDAYGFGSNKRLFVSVEDYPWKFILPQLLDSQGQEILYIVI
jgi:hypothetical protein